MTLLPFETKDINLPSPSTSKLVIPIVSASTSLNVFFPLILGAVSIGRFALFLPIFVVEIITVTLFSDIDEDLRKAFVAIFIIQLVLYSFLFLLDPGTLFEDE